MSFRWRVGTSGAAAVVLAAAAAGTSLGAVDVVELSAQQVVPGSVVTLRVATTAAEVRGESGALFMIPSGTFGDSPEPLRCEQVGGAVEVGQIQWTAGTVVYEGESYAGVTGEVMFTVPQLAPDTYRLAESIESRGTGCHIFALIDVVAELPDTALRLIEAAPKTGQALPGAALLGLALLLGCVQARGVVGRATVLVRGAMGIPLIGIAIALAGCGVAAPSGESLRPAAIGPGVTVAEDEAGGFVWRYVVYRTPDGYCDVVELAREADRPASRNCAGLGSGLNFSQRSESGRPSFVTGSVKSEAHRLLIDTRFDGVIETHAIEPPEALDLPFDLFVVALPEGSTIVGISAVDAEGQVVDEYESGLSP